jgi:hypothetical protein
MDNVDIDDILMAEIIEWQEAPPNTHHEIEELLDIMICCLIKAEKLLSKEPVSHSHKSSQTK